MTRKRTPSTCWWGSSSTPDFPVLRAALIHIEVIRANVARVDYVNGWRFILRESVWELIGVEDATDHIRAAVAAPVAAPDLVPRGLVAT